MNVKQPAIFFFLLFFFSGLLLPFFGRTQGTLQDYNITWTSQSLNSSESMPCGGGSVGLNVWTETNDILLYLSRSGDFDENNALLKAGRIRLKLSPNPFSGQFTQTLDLSSGAVIINGKNGRHATTVRCWVDVFRPVVHLQVSSSQPLMAEAIYENWRYRERPQTGRANNANSYKWTSHIPVKTYRDEISFEQNSVLFFHRNRADSTVFDVTVQQQGLDSVKDRLFNPLSLRTFGGRMEGRGLQPAGTVTGTYHATDYKGWKLATTRPVRQAEIVVTLHTEQTPTLQAWKDGLARTAAAGRQKKARENTEAWWAAFWKRSFVHTFPNAKDTASAVWQAGRNYQLFRYMLGCNAYGDYPTRFNGGLFTYDPALVDTAYPYTPDFRNWGGGTFTAQNQRLVYFPLLKSGDFDLLQPQLEFYRRLLPNAELRTAVYWKHRGASFTEQLENFGLPNPAEYGWKRPQGYDPGMQYNAWLEYQWDTVLEFCLMVLEKHRYSGGDISEYLPLIESCLRFFNEHYQYLAKQRGSRLYDSEGHLVFYPGSGAETFKMAYNATSTLAGLQTILTRLLELPATLLPEPNRGEWEAMLRRLPPIGRRQMNGHTTLAPAWLWQYMANKNVETVPLYPVFPWGLYGVGRPDLDIARNTWRYDSTVVNYKSHIGWRQHNIFAARLGLTDEAASLNTLKLQNSGRRFPAFWGPGYDWVPDHNWGGSGMVGLQEMLLQAVDDKIYLFPAWPKSWDVHFRLHAPGQTTVEASLKNGQIEWLKVLPASREKDLINLLDGQP